MTDTIQYRENEIYISYLGIVNSCAEYAGDIRFMEDTIVLELKNKGGRECASQTCARIRFTIKNQGNRKYIIKKW